MAQPYASDSKNSRLRLWTLAVIATIASSAALYFALKTHDEHLRAAALAAQLSMKEQELSEKQRQLESKKSALARMAVSMKQAIRTDAAQIVAPTPSSSFDEQAWMRLRRSRKCCARIFTRCGAGFTSHC